MPGTVLGSKNTETLVLCSEYPMGYTIINQPHKYITTTVKNVTKERKRCLMPRRYLTGQIDNIG